MTLQLLHSEFPYIWGKFYFLFLSVRVLSFSFFSSRRNSDSPPTPHPQARVWTPPPLFGWGGGHTRLRERGWGVPIPTRGHTLWYSVFISTLCPQPFPPPTSLALDPPPPSLLCPTFIDWSNLIAIIHLCGGPAVFGQVSNISCVRFFLICWDSKLGFYLHFAY
jgi:hypothetical protein